MTNLQAEYSRIVEQRRHNLATEQQTDVQLTEAQRHNIATEQLTDAQTQATLHGQELNAALTTARMALDKQISDNQLANARWLEKYKQDVAKELNAVKNATELYKADITKQNNLAQQTLRGRELDMQQTKLTSDINKTNADIAKLSADIEAKKKELEIKAGELEYKYAANPKARLGQMSQNVAQDTAEFLGGILSSMPEAIKIAATKKERKQSLDSTFAPKYTNVNGKAVDTSKFAKDNGSSAKNVSVNGRNVDTSRFYKDSDNS